MTMTMTMKTPKVNQISECFVKPKCAPEESNHPLYMTPWDLVMLSVHYIQKGLLFSKPSHQDENFMEDLLGNLKNSLSLTLNHFYPLSGRLKTIKSENPNSCLVYIDCSNDSPGAKFIYATLDMTVSDILTPTDVPSIVQSFFDHDRAVNYDGHTTSLVSIQVTELVDGVFIGCSMNHAIADGTSYWNFFNMWSEVFNNTNSISRPPIFKRWFPEGHGPKISLPYSGPEEFVGRFEAPELRERVFHFSVESLAKLKTKANTECNTNKISTFQSLSALIWRCITRARNLAPEQVTSCRLAANNRGRLDPPISENYFGNVIYPIRGFTTVGDLLEHDLGWAAWKLHEAVANHNDKTIRGLLDDWLESRRVFQLGQLFDPFSIMMGSSPRFNKYGIEFGMGKAVALRSGYANKFSGKVSCYPGHEGGGSIDLEMCLPPAAMSALESDNEFIQAIQCNNIMHT
ncbi:hypothetical protein F8388_001153 [Cannabis sativa]|uniref:Transferase, Chloramphenicol acetyltransferase-like domain protein n=1 Tax=Cannabis sativa TaxID=3483 RepID=A0A7J6ES45_CANSA|nr:hypothetical protein G4B88_030317 [Cannabis sativa]KAF4361264.1 hypothetical protein F8388_001153 [Cannabis sativa]